VGVRRWKCALILVSDANILIDLAAVQGLEFVLHLGTLEVLDVVLTEVKNDPRIPDLNALGVRIVTVEPEWIPQALVLKHGGLSLTDALCLHRSSTHRHVLLSNDGPLRKACAKAGVEIHGSLWVVLELHRLNLCEPAMLCGWLHDWETNLKARLPVAQLEQVRNTLGCKPS
jgi:hypothetical protein